MHDLSPCKGPPDAKNCLKNIKKWFPPGIEPGTYHLQLQRSTNSATQSERKFLKKLAV